MINEMIAVYLDGRSLGFPVETSKLSVYLIERQLLLQLVMLLIGSTQLRLLPVDQVFFRIQLALQLLDHILMVPCEAMM